MMQSKEIENKLTCIWNKYDKKKNGYLGRKEIKDFLEDIFDENSDDEEFEKIIEELDCNKNGKIGKKEMIKYIYNS